MSRLLHFHDFIGMFLLFLYTFKTKFTFIQNIDICMVSVVIYSVFFQITISDLKISHDQLQSANPGGLTTKVNILRH